MTAGIHGLWAMSFVGFILAVGAISDLQENRISNNITVPALAAGVLFTCIVDPAHIAARFAALIVLFIFWTLHAVGGGDVKLLMVAAAFCGPLHAVLSLGLASAGVVVVQLCKSPRTMLADCKSALAAMKRKDFRQLQAGRRVKFAPYLLFAHMVLCLVHLLAA